MIERLKLIMSHTEILTRNGSIMLKSRMRKSEEED